MKCLDDVIKNSISQPKNNLYRDGLVDEGYNIGVLVWLSIQIFILELKVKCLREIGCQDLHVNLSEVLSKAHPSAASKSVKTVKISLLTVRCQRQWMIDVPPVRQVFEGTLPLGSIVMQALVHNKRYLVTLLHFVSLHIAVMLKLIIRGCGCWRCESETFKNDPVQVLQFVNTIGIYELVKTFFLAEAVQRYTCLYLSLFKLFKLRSDSIKTFCLFDQMT